MKKEVVLGEYAVTSGEGLTEETSDVVGEVRSSFESESSSERGSEGAAVTAEEVKEVGRCLVMKFVYELWRACGSSVRAGCLGEPRRGAYAPTDCGWSSIAVTVEWSCTELRKMI